MKTAKKVSFLLFIAILVSGLSLTSCPDNTPGDPAEPPPGSGTPPARHIQVIVQPSAIRMTPADWGTAAADKKTLKVTLSESKTASSYQWYSRTGRTGEMTLIENAKSASYTPSITDTTPKDYYYYVIVTVDGKKLAGYAQISIVSSYDSGAPTSFDIGSERVHYVRGVGGTGSFMFRDGDNADASPDADVTYIDLLMGEIGCNILRIMVQDDYLNYIENKIQSRNVFKHDAQKNFFAVIRRVNQLGGYVFANPWTAPADYKTPPQITGKKPEQTTGSFLTNSPANHVAYANYLRDFLEWLNDNNAPIFALGICNEPDWGNNVEYEGMGMTRDQHRDWLKTVGHFTTQVVVGTPGTSSSQFDDDAIIPGYGGGGKTHHVLVMSGDGMGDPAYFDNTIDDSAANKNFEILGRHWYTGSVGANRVTKIAGPNGPTSSNPGTLWKDRPAGYVGHFEEESLDMSPQMYAPGSTAGNIKREVWQTEHDFNWGNSTTIPGTPTPNPQRYWNSAFAAMNDVDWAMRVVHESVFDWWFSSSYSGLVTSYKGAPVNGGADQTWVAGATEWFPYEYTPRGRAFAHYARYINETWSLPISKTRGSVNFNVTGTNNSGFNAGATDPKISAFEDVNGKFISIVMFTPNASTATPPGATTSGAIKNDFGMGAINGVVKGETTGSDDPGWLSENVGKVEVVLPSGFTATSASALRSYGWENADGKAWDDVPTGTPRYWISEPVLLYQTNGKYAVEVTLPGGNIISIMVKGTWDGRDVATPERKRPYTFN